MEQVSELDRQHLLFSDRTIPKIREICTDFTKEWNNKLGNNLQAYADYRHVPVEVFKDADIFLFDEDEGYVQIEDNATDLKIMQGRLIFPVKDVEGKVMGFCGYNPDKHPKYLDSATYGYKAKYSTFFGMEMLPKYIQDNKNGIPLFVTEGIVDCLIIRYLGFNCIALLGSYLNKIAQTLMLNTTGFYIADNDEKNSAGENFVRYSIKKIKSYITYVYRPHEWNDEEGKTHNVKDTNDAFRAYGVDAMRDTYSNIVKNMFYKNDILEVI